ncbi:PorT family protein [Microvenator marinus]|uniref:PorT family protein n=1 Tax=Microvenator marinus TaxID=2600177 RepID=A0A5B8XT54_9DELT|nr:PorT family protein [Microvenator marinus]QED27243.1 PorT family protein [Microvenator marinus]
MIKRAIIAGILSAVILPLSAQAQTKPVRVSAKAIVGFNHMAPPNDPAGEPTLLSGAGYSGLGFGGGLGAMATVANLSVGDLYVALDFLWVSHSGEGSASSPSTGQSRTVVFDANTIHLPMMVGISNKSKSLSYRFSLGPEVLLGMGTTSTITEENLPGDPQPLLTTPVTHVGVGAVIGFDWQASESLIVPVDLRITWDPSVATTTRERFDNYRSAAEPGAYQVAWDWFFALSVGLDYLVRNE